MVNGHWDLGKKIRTRRESLNMSRGSLCGDELELTVRQLGRIETGESLPTLPKLIFICEQLNVPVADLVDEKTIVLPEEYVILKDRILKTSHYREPKRLAERHELLNRIYTNFYNDLPEEEQIICDINNAFYSIHKDENFDKAYVLFDEYLEQVLKKSKFRENDLYIVNLYMFSKHRNSFVTNKKNFFKIVRRIEEEFQYYHGNMLILTTRIFLNSCSILVEHDEYAEIYDLLQVARAAMQLNQDFVKVPIVEMVEGKFFLFQKGDIKQAKKNYEKGSLFAKLIGDDYLSEKIMEEWEQDLQKFQDF